MDDHPAHLRAAEFLDGLEVAGGFFAESAVGFVYIPFLVFVGSLYFINVLGYSPGKAANVILITTAVCLVFEPPAGRWVDKVGPGLPITVALLMQAVALAWMGLLFTPTTTVAQMAISLALSCARPPPGTPTPSRMAIWRAPTTPSRDYRRTPWTPSNKRC